MIVLVIEPWAYFTLLALLIANMVVNVQKILLLRKADRGGAKP